LKSTSEKYTYNFCSIANCTTSQ